MAGTEKYLGAGRHDLGDLGTLVVTPGHEAIVCVVTASKTLIDDAYGTPQDLAGLVASEAAGRVRRVVIERIRERRGQ